MPKRDDSKLDLDIADWLSDEALSLCSPTTRGIWIDAIARMKQAKSGGVLSGPTHEVAKLCRCTAAHHFTVNDDGLSKDWFGRVWLNPPYGPQTGTWLRKLANHGNGIALIFARTETAMFHSWGWNEADGMLFLRGRLHFHWPDGERAAFNAGAPSVLIAYGAENAKRLSARQDLGHFVPLGALSPAGAEGKGGR